MEVHQAQDEPLIKAVGICRDFGRGAAKVRVLSDAHLQIPRNRLVVLKGRSGSGKTTMLNLLGALDQPTEGSIFFQGQEISRLSDRERTKIRRKYMGMVFQSYGLISLMSAYENVEFALRIAGIPKDQQEELAKKALEIVGLKARMHHRPYELSGGEQQRVAIARAIAHKPLLLIADEPTAELDSRTGLQMIQVFKRLVENEGMSIVMSTHDPSIMEIVDQVYELEDGKIVSVA